MEIQELSEYIIKFSNIIDENTCDSLLKGIKKEGVLAENLRESDLVKLSEIVTTYSDKYLADYIPPVDLSEKDSKYSHLELDALLIKEPTNDHFNVGGKDISNRYLTLFFILNDNTEDNSLNFPAQNIINFYKKGDLYIFPSYFTHRFLININKNSTFASISIHLCM